MTRIRYEFVGKPPLEFVATGIVLAANFLVSWSAIAFPSEFARERPEGAFTYAIRFRGGHIWYYPASLGHYLDWSFAIQFVLIGVAALIMYVHRDRVVRVGGPTAEMRAATLPPRKLLSSAGLWLGATFLSFLLCAAVAKIGGRLAPAAVMLVVASTIWFLASSARAAFHTWREAGIASPNLSEVIVFQSILSLAVVCFGTYFVIAAA